MEKMHISFIKDLKNWEFQQLFSHLNTALDDLTLNETRSTNTLLLEVAADLKPHVKSLLLLKHTNLSHPLTAVLKNKQRLRTQYLASFRLAIETGLLWYTPEVRLAAATLKSWVEDFKKDLYRTTIYEQTNVVRRVMHDKKKKSNIQEAITLLQLNGLLEEVSKLSEEIMVINKQRNHEIVSKQMAVVGLRENAYEDLRLVINAISIAYSKANDEDKEDLANLSSEINAILRIFRTKLLSRRTKSKNKRAQKAAMQELFMTTHKPAPAQINIPMVNYNELKLYDKRKATTTNTSQQTASKNTTSLKSSKKGGNSKLPPLSKN